ncbi:MAG: toprim domain-containing protein, partial [Myxococcota bacterium]
QVGVTLPDSSKSIPKVSSQHQHTLRLAGDFFTRCLVSHEGKTAGPMNYLTRERGLDAKQIACYGFGFCPHNASALLTWLRHHNVSPQSAARAGLVQITAGGQRAFFADRITIPLQNARGLIVGFGARAWGSKLQKPKYLNSPASDLYDKSSFLYGLPQALPLLKQGEPAILVEGYFDVIALQGLNKAAVSACGTSLTPRQVEVLRRYTCEVILCLDADAAGQSASKRALLLLLQHGFRVRNVCLQQSDPAQLYCSGKGKQLDQQVQQAPDALEMLIRQIAQRVGTSPAQRLKQLDELLPFLSAPARALHVQQYTRLAAQLLGEHEKTLQQEIASYRRGNKFRGVQTRAVQTSTPVPGWREMDNLLLQLFLNHPQLASQCPQNILEQSHNLLQAFVRDLASALQQQDVKEPKDALRRVHICADSPIAPLLIRAQQEGMSPCIQEAQAILQQWEAKIALTQKEQQLRKPKLLSCRKT